MDSLILSKMIVPHYFKMALVNINNKSIYIDGFLKKNLDIAGDAVPNKNDMFLGLIDGRSGSGKSTLVDQLAYYQTKGNFSLAEKSFTVADFSELLSEAKKGDTNNCKILDEGYEINKKKTQSKANYNILRQLQRVRNKGQFLWICLPSVYDLDKNIILNLATVFIHCYRKKGLYGERGHYLVYDAHRLKLLYLKCRDTLSYSISANFSGSFNHKFPSGSYEDYEKKKDEAFERIESENEKNSIVMDQRNMAIFNLKTQFNMTQVQISKALDMNQSTVSRVLSKLES